MNTHFKIANHSAWIIFLVGASILATHPILWLVNTWIDPSYHSHGLLVFALVVGLFVWSLSSSRIVLENKNRHHAILLLAVTAIVRLLAQVLAINIIGALALVFDVYALGLLLQLNNRRRSASPQWLAVLFIFCLPVERVVQRVAGYGLQHLSALGAYRVMKALFDNVTCEGVRIIVGATDVLVDLPCSGARGLLQLLLLFTTIAVVRQPKIVQALMGLAGTLLAAFVGNTVRISILAVGIVYREQWGGFNVMEPPWHDLIGLVALSLGAFPIVLWARRIVAPSKETLSDPTYSSQSSPFLNPLTGWPSHLFAALFVTFSLVIVFLPRKPVDVSAKVPLPALPASLGSEVAEPVSLTQSEQAYFTRYGGSAAKARYGIHSLLAVRTSSPLRHLHAPDECLSGAGHEVDFLGAEMKRLPSAIYRSTSPNGRQYRIRVTFVSNKGHITTNVSEAVWHWLNEPAIVWTMLERISPWNAPAQTLIVLDEGVAQAFDVPASQAMGLLCCESK
jgi:exosortase